MTDEASISAWEELGRAAHGPIGHPNLGLRRRNAAVGTASERVVESCAGNLCPFPGDLKRRDRRQATRITHWSASPEDSHANPRDFSRITNTWLNRVIYAFLADTHRDGEVSEPFAYTRCLTSYRALRARCASQQTRSAPRPPAPTGGAQHSPSSELC
jgi:hypothetical protein